jgi:NagD protein
MDGVLVREQHAIPGAARFLEALSAHDTPFLVLTNNSTHTPRDMAARLRIHDVDVPGEAIWTAALATARFLHDQRPGGSAFMIGEAGLSTALHQAGYTLTDRDPDYVVLGETRTYSFERITQAVGLIANGARFVATNPDATSPSSDGPLPATGAVAALIGRATGVEPYFVGKPNPLMMRSALNALGAHPAGRSSRARARCRGETTITRLTWRSSSRPSSREHSRRPVWCGGRLLLRVGERPKQQHRRGGRVGAIGVSRSRHLLTAGANPHAAHTARGRAAWRAAFAVRSARQSAIDVRRRGSRR